MVLCIMSNNCSSTRFDDLIFVSRFRRESKHQMRMRNRKGNAARQDDAQSKEANV